MPVSQNGWSANDRSVIHNPTVPGTSITLPGGVRDGAAGTVLLYVAARFHREVEALRDGWNWGYAERPIRGGTDLSNHASGTAIDLNAPDHPLGAVGTFTTGQRAAIRRILDACGGVVRWGGDYSGRKDEMHFEIDASHAAVARVARNLNHVEDDVSEQDVYDALNSARGRDAIRDAVQEALAGEHGQGSLTQGVREYFNPAWHPSRVPGGEKVHISLKGGILNADAYGWETSRRLDRVVQLIAQQHNITPDQLADTLAPRLSAELLPTLAEIVGDVLGTDNQDQADAIVNELVRRLAEGEAA